MGHWKMHLRPTPKKKKQKNQPIKSQIIIGLELN
jgi:hypothetical protein